MTTVRCATRQDSHQLAELVRQEVELQQRLSRHFQLVPEVDWARYVSAKLQRSDCAIQVAEQDGRLVGFVEVRFIEPGHYAGGSRLRARARRLFRPWRKHTERLGVIEDVYVLPAHREGGIATALVLQGMHWLQSQRVAQVQAAIWSDNQASLSFAQKLGFEKIRLTMSKKLHRKSEDRHGETLVVQSN